MFVRFALEKMEHVHTSILVLIDTKSIALKAVLDHPGPQNHQDSTDWIVGLALKIPLPPHIVILSYPHRIDKDRSG